MIKAMILALFSLPAAAAGREPMRMRDIYRKAAPAVVLIISNHPDGNMALASGVIIDGNGRVITSTTAVSCGGKTCENVRIYLKPDRVTGDDKKDLVSALAADVVKTDAESKIVLLQIKEPPATLKSLALGDSADVKPGDKVAAIGHPPQKASLWTLFQGVITEAGNDVLKHDASAKKGTEGGPLLNVYGELIGMILPPADGAKSFEARSLPSNVIKRWLSSGKAK